VSAADELKARVDTIEEAYEFFLAYAAQGVSGEQAIKSAGQVREFLQRSTLALTELADLLAALVDERKLDSPGVYRDFIEVVRRDAGTAGAAMRLVLVQTAISSQMVDNLNAMIHLRALLTDVFLIDEIISPRVPAPSTLPSS
jgi:uncharacterized protein YutE (UPF0331/DUF86 family)